MARRWPQAILSATRWHRQMRPGQRGELANNIRRTRAKGHKVTARWSELLQRYVVWSCVYFIPVKRQLIEEIESNVPRGTIGRIFPYTRQWAWKLITRACALAGIEDGRSHPHTFRHSFAVNCIVSGVPVVVVKDWLGHSNIASTLVYTKVLSQDTKRFLDEMRF